MRKLITFLSASALLVGMLALPAAAAQNPAVNADACSAVGGDFIGSGPGRPDNECRVGDAAETVVEVPASHPRQAWKALITIPAGVQVYTFRVEGTGNPHDVEVIGGGEPYQSGCLNHQNKPITDWETNPNCVPAA